MTVYEVTLSVFQHQESKKGLVERLKEELFRVGESVRADEYKEWLRDAKRGKATASSMPQVIRNAPKPPLVEVSNESVTRVDPSCKKALAAEKRKELEMQKEAKKQKKNDKTEKKTPKKKVKAGQKATKPRAKPNGPLQVAFQKFISEQREAGVSYACALKAWMCSGERFIIVSGMSEAEIRRRRYSKYDKEMARASKKLKE